MNKIINIKFEHYDFKIRSEFKKDEYNCTKHRIIYMSPDYKGNYILIFRFKYILSYKYHFIKWFNILYIITIYKLNNRSRI